MDVYWPPSVELRDRDDSDDSTRYPGVGWMGLRKKIIFELKDKQMMLRVQTPFPLLKSFMPMHPKIKQENEQKDGKPRNAKEN